MATGNINTSIPIEYINQFSRPISANAVSKLSQFSFLQQLSYNGILEYLKENFLGIQEWSDQINRYSQSNAILRSAYSIIAPQVSKNQFIQENIIDDKNLGKIGNLFSSIEGFNKTFSINTQDLLNTKSISDTVSNTNVL